MQFGLDIVNLGEYVHPDVLLRLAKAAEEAGWEALFLWDHLGFVWGAPSGDPWIMLAMLANATTTLKLGTAVSPLPRYRPHMLAHTVATLDIMSKGRAVLGVGLGGVAQEYSAFGEQSDPKVHAAMVDEGLMVVNQLWSGEVVTHQGNHYKVDQVKLQPVPIQRPRVPIWIGGESNAALRRAARWDGWIVSGASQDGSLSKTPDELAQRISELQTLRSEIDTTHPLPFDIVFSGYSTPADSALVREYEAVGATWWLESLHGFRGSVDEMIARVLAGPSR